MRIGFVLGTRPEIIKLSPVVRAAERRGLEFDVVHTGQHYSERLDEVFFDDLNLPSPTYNLRVGSGSHGQQTGAMLGQIESILQSESYDVVLVQGDTNSVLAGALAASKLDVELGHVEAGLRSFDEEMPEEVNRKLADHVADYLFAPTEQAGETLLDENLSSDRVFVTGNTVTDAVEQNRRLAPDAADVLARYGVEATEFYLLTAHRAENVDESDRFADVLTGVGRFAADRGVPVFYPIHPRARTRLDEFELDVPEMVTLVEPLDYLDFLALEDEAALVFTDSGGVQEEACILETPCVTIRDNTERPETISVGANALAGTDPGRIADVATRMLSKPGTWENPLGDGTAARQILDVLGREVNTS
jgi:UDP-N-acetylglucosamine 2-epimerase (non-hydrolysing)